jgi:hypothetical protein
LIASRHAFVGDLVQPRAEPLVALERGAAAPRAQQRLLDEVLGLLEGAEHPVAVDVQLAAMALGARGELCFGAGHAAHHRPAAGRAETIALGVMGRSVMPV